MDRERVTEFLGRVNALDGGQVFDLNAEQAGLLQGFIQSRQKTNAPVPASERHLMETSIRLLKRWRDTQPPPPPSADGQDRRTQQRLHAAIAKMERHEFDTLGTEDVALVEGLFKTLENYPGPDPTRTRLRSVLAAALEEYRRHVDVVHTSELFGNGSGGGSGSNGGNGHGKAVQMGVSVVAGDFFTPRTKRHISELGGVEVNILARVYEIAGPVSIRGDVPDDVLLVVTEEGVSIEGCVFGHVLAQENIAISETVQGGWVISRDEAIQAGRILSGARVVARRGNVTCDEAENPEFIFASNEIHVKADLHDGHLIARKIRVEGRVVGGELHATDWMEAERYECAAGRTTVLCLRSWLSSEDYGHPLEPEARKLRRTADAYKYRLQCIRRRLPRAAEDINNCMRSMLYHELGRVNKRSEVCLLRGAQSQILFLGELLELGEKLSGDLGAMAFGSGSDFSDDIVGAAAECIRLGEDLEAEIKAIPAEFGAVDRGGLISAVRQLTYLSKSLKAAASEDGDKLGELLATLDGRMGAWRQQLAVASIKADHLIGRFGLSGEVIELIEGDPHELPVMMDKLLSGPKGTNSAGIRGRSGFLRTMERTIDFHRRMITRWKEEMKEIQTALDEIYAKLQRESAIIFAGPKAGEARTEGNHFDAGVVITSRPGSVVAEADDMAAAIELAGPVNQHAVYKLVHGKIQRQK